ncbi:MAG TPA: DNRLRE domain-containing protein [Thermoguttaceae bacterium]|nr:DNRLRE domain-containing protein [Thermoguttaceae bacterium]
MKARCTILLAALLLGWAAMASAETIVYQEDISPDASYQTNVVYTRSTEAPNGGNKEGSTWQLGRVANATVDDLMRCIAGFDLSAIPTGATINSVTLTVAPRQNDTTSLNAAYEIQLHKITNDNFTETGVTWFVRDIANPTTTAWTTAGGDYDSTVLSTITANPKTWCDSLPAGYSANTTITYVFPTSSAFVAAVQDAADTDNVLNLLLRSAAVEALPFSSTNRSIFPLVSDEPVTTGTTNRRTVQEMAPKLTIDYTPVPEPGALVLLSGIALIGLALRGGRKA